MNNKKMSSRRKADKDETGPVMSEPGEQVYFENADEILAGKIVERTHSDSQPASGDNEGTGVSAENDREPCPEKRTPPVMMRIFALAAIGAAILIVAARAFFRGKSRRGSRKRR